MKQKIVWVLTADASRARIIETHRLLADGGFRQIAAYDNALQPSHAIGSDRPGRSFDSGHGGQRHAMQPPSDPHREQKIKFADRLAHELNAAALAGKFERLAIAAPPAMLGDIRAALDAHARDRLFKSVAKDLMHVGLDDLGPHLTQD